jgi:hypothetical protein
MKGFEGLELDIPGGEGDRHWEKSCMVVSFYGERKTSFF